MIESIHWVQKIMEKKSFIKSIKIQIIASFFLIVLGILAYNLLQISNFNSSNNKYSINKTTFDSKNLKSKLARSEKNSNHEKSFNFAKFTIKEDFPENIEELNFVSLSDTKPEEKQKETSSRAELNDLKYDGYMKVGNSEIVWITKGTDRISASKNSIITDNFLIEEIHESYLVIKDRENNISQSIPFTGINNTNKFTAVYNESKVIPKAQANLSNNYAQIQRTLDQNRNRITNSSTERQTNTNIRRDQIYDMPPQIPLDDAPPMPW